MTPPKFLADEDLREDIVHAVLALDPSIDLVTKCVEDAENLA